MQRREANSIIQWKSLLARKVNMKLGQFDRAYGLVAAIACAHNSCSQNRFHSVSVGNNEPRRIHYYYYCYCFQTKTYVPGVLAACVDVCDRERGGRWMRIGKIQKRHLTLQALDDVFGKCFTTQNFCHCRRRMLLILNRRSQLNQNDH